MSVAYEKKHFNVQDTFTFLKKKGDEVLDLLFRIQGNTGQLRPLRAHGFSHKRFLDRLFENPPSPTAFKTLNKYNIVSAILTFAQLR
jgi:hypothetical protein